MLTLNAKYYSALATMLADLIDESDFYSGSVIYSVQDIDCEFISTLLIYRDKVYESYTTPPIKDIVPIWWEFTTTLDDEPLLNDFDFQFLKDIICQ